MDSPETVIVKSEENKTKGDFKFMAAFRTPIHKTTVDLEVRTVKICFEAVKKANTTKL